MQLQASPVVQQGEECVQYAFEPDLQGCAVLDERGDHVAIRVDSSFCPPAS